MMSARIRRNAEAVVALRNRSSSWFVPSTVLHSVVFLSVRPSVRPSVCLSVNQQFQCDQLTTEPQPRQNVSYLSLATITVKWIHCYMDIMTHYVVICLARCTSISYIKCTQSTYVRLRTFQSSDDAPFAQAYDYSQ